MGALRKQKQPSRGHVANASRAPEALQYNDDVTPEVVKSIQEKANKILGEEELVVIDGYVGKR
jgi:hypothetical protein